MDMCMDMGIHGHVHGHVHAHGHAHGHVHVHVRVHVHVHVQVQGDMRAARGETCTRMRGWHVHIKRMQRHRLGSGGAARSRSGLR